jgi:hypothetical protein
MTPRTATTPVIPDETSTPSASPFFFFLNGKELMRATAISLIGGDASSYLVCPL